MNVESQRELLNSMSRYGEYEFNFNIITNLTQLEDIAYEVSTTKTDEDIQRILIYLNRINSNLTIARETLRG